MSKCPEERSWPILYRLDMNCVQITGADNPSEPPIQSSRVVEVNMIKYLDKVVMFTPVFGEVLVRVVQFRGVAKEI
jgi:hypothetical protein